MTKSPRLIIATNNHDKLAEISDILKGTNIEILSAKDFSDFPDVEETGETLTDNALLKARSVWEKYHLPCLGDDTGLEIDFLNGAPGVYSSRYAGPDATYDDNCNKLLGELKSRNPASRRARFRTVMAFIDPDGHQHIAEGTIEGEIIHEKRGSNGFGYDPVFYVPDKNKTLAEMEAAEKNKISHRHNALVKIMPVILMKLLK
ncbi:MAG: XTP/dITP diphosphatase [candidate division Zixibacteria bacterium]|nr:XTP/dITP diphosphatase [candidate division Zixibacteria bacterium]